MSITRSGPHELLRGFLASSLRDAPYAGLFVVFYEGIKHEACKPSFFQGCRELTFLFLAIIFPAVSVGQASTIHCMSAASAGAVSTMLTHPFDVIKVAFTIFLCFQSVLIDF